MVLELDEKEAELLRHALENFENELRDLIVRTDKKEARISLHEDEVVAKKILEHIGREGHPVG